MLIPKISHECGGFYPGALVYHGFYQNNVVECQYVLIVSSVSHMHLSLKKLPCNYS